MSELDELRTQLGSKQLQIADLQTANKSLKETNESVYKLYKLGTEDINSLKETNATRERDSERLGEKVTSLSNELSYANKRIAKLQEGGVQVVNVGENTNQKIKQDLKESNELNKTLNENEALLKYDNHQLRNQLTTEQEKVTVLETEIAKLVKLKEDLARLILTHSATLLSEEVLNNVPTKS